MSELWIPARRGSQILPLLRFVRPAGGAAAAAEELSRSAAALIHSAAAGADPGAVRAAERGEAARFRERVQREEADYQTLLAEALDGML